MEIMRETPWSRIRERNSVYKELEEIVGSGKPTGSVQKETSVVSDTICISVQKQRNRILLRIVSCGRMREMRREPKRQESQWKDVSMALQGLPQRTLHQFILWKMASSYMLVLQVREWMPIRRNVLLCASPGWWTADVKVQKEWWQKCSGYVENCTTIGLRLWRYGAAEVFIDFAEELEHTETNEMCWIKWRRGASC